MVGAEVVVLVGDAVGVGLTLSGWAALLFMTAIAPAMLATATMAMMTAAKSIFLFFLGGCVVGGGGGGVVSKELWFNILHCR